MVVFVLSFAILWCLSCTLRFAEPAGEQGSYLHFVLRLTGKPFTRQIIVYCDGTSFVY